MMFVPPNPALPLFTDTAPAIVVLPLKLTLPVEPPATIRLPIDTGLGNGSVPVPSAVKAAEGEVIVAEEVTVTPVVTPMPAVAPSEIGLVEEPLTAHSRSPPLMVIG